MKENTKTRLLLFMTCFIISFSISFLTNRVSEYKERINELENQVMEQSKEIENYKSQMEEIIWKKELMN